MEKVLVTGGTGLVGQGIKVHEHEYPHCEFHYLSSQDCDLRNWEDTEELFVRLRPTYVIHLAANVGGLLKNMCSKVQMFEANILININVLRAANKVGVRRLVACLSTCIFPDVAPYPLTTEMLHLGPPHPSNEGYAYAKRMLEVQCRNYREQYEDDFVCVIPTNVYGPHDNFSLQNGHVIPTLIHKCYLAQQREEDFVVGGTGTPLRQFVFAPDLGKVILKFLLESTDSSSLIVAPSPEVSIGEVARMIAKEMGWEDRIVFRSTIPDGQVKKTALCSLTNFTPLAQGLKETVKWFIDHYPHVRT